MKTKILLTKMLFLTPSQGQCLDVQFVHKLMFSSSEMSWTAALPIIFSSAVLLGLKASALRFRGMGLGQVVEEMIEVQERDLLICSSLPGVVGAHKPCDGRRHAPQSRSAPSVACSSTADRSKMPMTSGSAISTTSSSSCQIGQHGHDERGSWI